MSGGAAFSQLSGACNVINCTLVRRSHCGNSGCVGTDALPGGKCDHFRITSSKMHQMISRSRQNSTFIFDLLTNPTANIKQTLILSYCFMFSVFIFLTTLSNKIKPVGCYENIRQLKWHDRPCKYKPDAPLRNIFIAMLTESVTLSQQVNLRGDGFSGEDLL